jgi:hypothetical protein
MTTRPKRPRPLYQVRAGFRSNGLAAVLGARLGLEKVGRVTVLTLKM